MTALLSRAELKRARNTWEHDRQSAVPFSVNQLYRALLYVVRHRKMAGFDGKAPKDFTNGRDVFTNEVRLDKPRIRAFARRLHGHLARGKYRFTPSTAVFIHQDGRAKRKVAVSTLGDAAVLKAIVNALKHLWELLPANFIGGRPGARASVVADEIGAVLRCAESDGRELWFIKTDFRKAFESAPRNLAIHRLGQMTPSLSCITLLKDWYGLQSEARFPGLVQGSASGPILLYALLADWLPEVMRDSLHWRLWLDDLLGFFSTRDEAEKALFALRRGLRLLDGMKLHPKKLDWDVVKASATGVTKFDFGGREWLRCIQQPSGRSRQKAVAEIVERFRKNHSERAIHRAVRGFVRSRMDCLSFMGVYREMDKEIATRVGVAEVRLFETAAWAARAAPVTGPCGARTPSGVPGNDRRLPPGISKKGAAQEEDEDDELHDDYADEESDYDS